MTATLNQPAEWAGINGTIIDKTEVNGHRYWLFSCIHQCVSRQWWLADGDDKLTFNPIRLSGRLVWAARLALPIGSIAGYPVSSGGVIVGW